MQSSVLIDGRLRSPVTVPGHNRGVKPANAGKKYPAEPYTAEEVEQLLKACGRGYAGARNRAMWVVMWRAGLRVGETLALYPRDINAANGTVFVRDSKNGESRVSGIDPQAIAYVEAWLAKRAELGVNGRHPLFCVIQRPRVGHALDTSSVREALHKAAERAGLDRRCPPHAWRHTCAFEMYREGQPLLIIQKQLGHKWLSSTATYINHIAPTEVIDAMRTRQWGAFLSEKAGG